MAAPDATSSESAQAANADSLHSLSNTASSAVHKLATGLAHAGAPTEVVQAVTKIGDQLDKVTDALGKGQEQTGDEEAPPDEPVPGAEPETPTRPRTIQSATEDLHREHMAAAGVKPRY